MKKIRVRVFFITAAAVCLLWMAGCGDLSELHEAGSGAAQTVQPMPTATPVSTPTPTYTPTPDIQKVAGFLADLDSDGEEEDIFIIYDEFEGEHYGKVIIAVLDNSEIVKAEEVTYDTFDKAFITKTADGSICVFVSISGENDYYTTYVYSFSALQPILREELDFRVVKVEETTISSIEDVFAIGDWECYRKYRLNDDYSFTDLSSADLKIVQGREPLYTIRDLPVEMLVDGVYRADTLPPDTELFPTSTDGHSYLCFRLEDGLEGRINFSRSEEDGHDYINGTIVDEYFETVLYSR